MSETKSQTQHPEWEKESALTSPSDRNQDRSYLKQNNGGVPDLTQEESKAAMATLNKDAYVHLNFPRVERRYADGNIPLQNFGLISFVPAKGATPNEKGVYGFAKLRGNFASNKESNERAEQVIRTMDSYHRIYHAYVGRPFPLSFNPDYVSETNEVDVRKTMTESVSDNIKIKKEEEQRTVSEIKDRERALLDDVKNEDDPVDHYTMLRTKKAQISWTYESTLKKLDEMKNIVISTHREILRMDVDNPTFNEKFFEKYKKARVEAGISLDIHGDNFIKYMVDDVKFDFLEGLEPATVDYEKKEELITDKPSDFGVKKAQ
jgi:hypothetical protein